MSSRKLVRCVSTCSEDLLDASLNELSQLNQRHAVLRQQLFARKNNKSKYRPSGSVCSLSSSSSTSSSSMSSSFSSSMSATMSSSESWDSFSDPSDRSMSSATSSIDCPKVVRRLSKPKLNMYRPYSKPYPNPRRFSLQLGSHPESPETTDDLSHQSSAHVVPPARPHSSALVCPSTRCVTPPKYSRLVSEKENFSAGSSQSPIKVKSNPTSPSRCDLSAVLLQSDANLIQFNAIDDRFVSNTSTNNCSALVGSQPMLSTGVLLLRSKSLDDLILCSGADPYQSSSVVSAPKQSPSMATASSCDIDNVLQRISSLQV